MSLEIFVVLSAVLFINVLTVWKIVSAIMNMEDLIRTIAKRLNPTNLQATYKDYTELNKEEAQEQKKKTLNIIDSLILSSLSSGVKKKIIAELNTQEPRQKQQYIDGKVFDTNFATIIAKKIETNFVEWLMMSADGTKFVLQYDYLVDDSKDDSRSAILLSDIMYRNILNEMVSDDNHWDVLLDGFDPDNELTKIPSAQPEDDIKLESVTSEAVITSAQSDDNKAVGEAAKDSKVD